MCSTCETVNVIDITSTGYEPKDCLNCSNGVFGSRDTNSNIEHDGKELDLGTVQGKNKQDTVCGGLKQVTVCGMSKQGTACGTKQGTVSRIGKLGTVSRIGKQGTVCESEVPVRILKSIPKGEKFVRLYLTDGSRKLLSKKELVHQKIFDQLPDLFSSEVIWPANSFHLRSNGSLGPIWLGTSRKQKKNKKIVNEQCTQTDFTGLKVEKGTQTNNLPVPKPQKIVYFVEKEVGKSPSIL